MNDVTHRPTRAAWKSSVPTEQATTGLTTLGLTVITLATAAVFALGVAQLVTIPLTAALMAGMGVGGGMLFRSRRLR
jgi:hypothetical protein